MARTAPKLQPLSERELLRILKDEETDAASYYASELAQTQAEAMDRYHAKPYGDGSERPNRSAVVTHDIEDTINWTMPHIQRTFSSSDDLITVEDESCVVSDGDLKTAAQYLNHVFFKDNPGETIIHDFAFDALLQKIGVLRSWWEDPQAKPPQILEGVTVDQLVRYVNDPDYEILEQSIDGEIEGAEEQDEHDGDDKPADGELKLIGHEPNEKPEPTFTLRIQHKPRVGRARVEVVPPEEFRISRRAKSIEAADYHAWRREVYVAELLNEFPEQADALEPDNFATLKADEINSDTDNRKLARFPDEPSTGQRVSHYDPQRRKVWENIEYIRIDADGDGVVELRRIRRVGDTILENDAADESEFVMWTPIKVSHRAIGRSLADTLIDIQKIRTALTRRAMDSLSRATAPRVLVNASATRKDPSLLDRLLDHDVGDAIEVEGNPNEVVRELITTDVSPIAMQAIEYWDRRSEEASGVNRHAMGIQPQAITDTAKGIENLQAAANSRIEQVARWLAVALESAFGKLLRLLIAHQDHARVVKIAGKRMEIDPRRWSDEMGVSVHVGMSADSREKRILYLKDTLDQQQIAYERLGDGNPLVSLQEIRNTLALLSEAKGYKNADRFWRQIPENWKPPEPGKDPKQLEVEGKLQLQQADMQQRGQIETQKLQGQLQIQHAEMQGKQQLAAQDVEVQRALAAAKAQSDREAAALKAESDMKIAQMRMELEARIASERLAAEMELARWKTQLEIAHAHSMPSSDTTRLPANRPGGKLDA